MYYRSAACVIVVFDVTRPKTFDSLKYWIQEIQKKGSQNSKIVIAANKIDAENREIGTEIAAQFAEQVGAMYVETSALDGRGVEEMFTELAKEKLEQVKKEELKLVQVVSDRDGSEGWKCCE